jgi:hypothetical protein
MPQDDIMNKNNMIFTAPVRGGHLLILCLHPCMYHIHQAAFYKSRQFNQGIIPVAPVRAVFPAPLMDGLVVPPDVVADLQKQGYANCPTAAVP